MFDAGQFTDYWKRRIERDLASFGDPGALVDVSPAGRGFRAAWTMQGKEREALFSVSRDQGVSVRTAGRKVSYRSFLAGADMADLQSLAQMILQAMPPGLFVETRAERSDAAGDPTTSSAVKLLTDLLEGEGQLLASARSVYYEEEFLARAGRVSATGDQRWAHVPVRVLEWSDEDRRRYLDQWAADRGLTDEASERLGRRVRTIFDDGREELAKKPLFFARVVELLWNNPEFSAGGDLLQALVREYLSRERKEKLLDRQSGSLLTEEQFERLMCELAQEMWNQETRELDSRSVREVAEFFVESEDLSEAAKQSVVERMPALAFLAQSDEESLRGGGISFEHELFFFHFLARAVVSEFNSTGADVRIVLSRSALPDDVAERVAAQLNARDGAGARGRLQKRLDRLADAGRKEWRRTMQVRENAGLLVMALLRYAGEDGREIDGCTVRSVVFPGGRLGRVTLKCCSLVDVEIRRTDLTEARFVECTARDVLLFEPRVGPGTTRLELEGLDVSHVIGLRVPETVYDPSAVAATLKECGAPTPGLDQATGSGAPSPYVDLVERLVRAYRRANPVCTEDPALAGLLGDPKWAVVERLLVEHEIVTKEHRATSGRPKTFLRRRVKPEQLMSGRNGGVNGVPRIVRSFWRALESETAAGDARSNPL